MAGKRFEYTVGFFVPRLVALLEDAGFEVRPPTQLAHGMVQLVSDPASRQVWLESKDPTTGEWRRLMRPERQPIESIPPGQYL